MMLGDRSPRRVAEREPTKKDRRDCRYNVEHKESAYVCFGSQAEYEMPSAAIF